MVLDPPIERLQLALTALVALGRRIQRTIANLHAGVTAHSDAGDLLARIEDMAGAHLDALFERMQIPPHDDPKAGVGLEGWSGNQNQFGELHPVSNALGVAYALLQEAVIGYSTIQPIALRTQDSWVMADEGTTAHISRRHTQEYLGVAGQITALIHDVVLWELERDGLVCRCTCPSCSIGVCIGVISSRAVLDEAWIAARPPGAEHGVELKPPRPGSAASD